MQQQFEPQNTTTDTERLRRTQTREEAAVEENTPLAADPAAQHLDVSAVISTANSTAQTTAAGVDFEQLLTVIGQETKKRKKNLWIFLGIYAGVFCLLLLIVVMIGLRTGHFPGAILSGLGSFGGLTAVVAGVTAAQKDATKQIAQFDQVRAVGPLIDALVFGDSHLMQVVVPGLIRLLPRLQASDAPLLNAEQRATLNRQLLARPGKTSQTLPFYEAILRALQQVGDEKSLSVVERLIHGEGMAARYPELRAQAEETLPFLRQRIEQARASHTLLRASAAGQAAPDTLLRAATATPSADDPRQLLRADLREPF